MDFSIARNNMVECQLRPNRITDNAVLAAMGTLPRERFLPESLRSVAYADEDLCIAAGRYIMEPVVVGRLIQAAEPRSGGVALVVGGGTGYEAAVLAGMVGTVFVLESDKGLSDAASRLYSELALDNVVAVDGPLGNGLPDQGPYDVILINGAVQVLPDSLTAQLAQGGRLVCVVDEGRGVGRATLLQRTAGGISRRVVFDASVPVLEEFRKAPSFVF
jgi:protein-L-isoaspartate(D-aspartate) O-methyltransferase